jgi:hypothetical protein
MVKDMARMVKDMERDGWESCKHKKGSVGKKRDGSMIFQSLLQL